MKQRIEHAPPLCASASLRKKTLYHRIAAEFAAAAVSAEIPSPNGIELLDKRFDKRRIVCQNAILEVTLALRLRAHPGTGQVCRAEVCLHAVNNDALEMHARAEHPFQRRPERRIAIEVVPPVRSRILRMDEPHLDPALHHPVQLRQERHHPPPASINVHILDVRSGSCDRYAAHSLRSFGQPDRLRQQANVAIHNRSFACGTTPQTAEV